MEIRLLGALEVIDGSGLTVTVAGAKLRALLALLAVQPGRVVSVDRLVDDLWGADAGGTAHVATVIDLGGWRADRSYAWTGLVRELSVAAIALSDAKLCSQLLADVVPVAATCGVSGAVVSFSGSHAHTAALLSAALGRESEAFFAQARAIYTRLGAAGWLFELANQEAMWSVPAAPSSPAGSAPPQTIGYAAPGAGMGRDRAGTT